MQSWFINLAEWNVSWLSHPWAHLSAAKNPAAEVIAAKPGSGKWGDILRGDPHASQRTHTHTDPVHPGGTAITGKHIRRAMLYRGCSEANMSASTAAQRCRGGRGHVQAGHGPQAQARQTGLWPQALSTVCPGPTSTPLSQLSSKLSCFVAFPIANSHPSLGIGGAIPLSSGCQLARVKSPFACFPIIASASLPDFSSTQCYL